MHGLSAIKVTTPVKSRTDAIRINSEGSLIHMNIN